MWLYRDVLIQRGYLFFGEISKSIPASEHKKSFFCTSGVTRNENTIVFY